MSLEHKEDEVILKLVHMKRGLLDLIALHEWDKARRYIVLIEQLDNQFYDLRGKRRKKENK